MDSSESGLAGDAPLIRTIEGFTFEKTKFDMTGEGDSERFHTMLARMLLGIAAGREGTFETAIMRVRDVVISHLPEDEAGKAGLLDYESLLLIINNMALQYSDVIIPELAGERPSIRGKLRWWWNQKRGISR
ncbi:MAG: hypothetical protein Fur003_0260 [Candidatus Dojkabacteria bacterium]